MAGISISKLGIRNSNSFRCWLCERNWPFKDEYEECPCCREKCKGDAKAPDTTEVAARHVAQEFRFGWWLWDTGQL